MKINDFTTNKFSILNQKECKRLDRKMDKIFAVLNSDKHKEDVMSLLPIMIANIYGCLSKSKDIDEAKINLKVMQDAILDILEHEGWE